MPTDASDRSVLPDPARTAGKTVIVTGAASGIGRATASRIAREGGHVIGVDLSAERLEALAASVPDGAITAVVGDITRQDDIDRIVAAAVGHIDALASVAGVNDDFSPVHENSDEIRDRVIGINLTAPYSPPTGAGRSSNAQTPVAVDRRAGLVTRRSAFTPPVHPHARVPSSAGRRATWQS
ncbi:SDR family NAD(P)-dependent oxidoreductase [Streptomyces sp. LZ34]